MSSAQIAAYTTAFMLFGIKDLSHYVEFHRKIRQHIRVDPSLISLVTVPLADFIRFTKLWLHILDELKKAHTRHPDKLSKLLSLPLVFFSHLSYEKIMQRQSDIARLHEVAD